MRYHVEPRRDDTGRLAGWGIWDDEMSPALERAGMRPWCGLEGRELNFTIMTKAWQWLADCQGRGLSMGTPGMTMRVLRSGPTGGMVAFDREHTHGDRPLHPGEA